MTRIPDRCSVAAWDGVDRTRIARTTCGEAAPPFRRDPLETPVERRQAFLEPSSVPIDGEDVELLELPPRAIAADPDIRRRGWSIDRGSVRGRHILTRPIAAKGMRQ